jgi:hypothetical protein
VEIQKQRISGDYLQTSAVFDSDFRVLSAINDANDYQGPGTGYRLEGRTKDQIVQIGQAIDPRDISEGPPGEEGKIVMQEIGDAAVGAVPEEVVIALGPAFGTRLTQTINGLPHDGILKGMINAIEKEGVRARIVKIYDTSDCAFIGHKGAQLSGSGIAIGLQSKGTAVIHRKDVPPLDNLELFSQASNLNLDAYSMIGRNAAAYARGETPVPVPKTIDNMARLKHIVKTTLMHRAETEEVIPGKEPVELEVEFT